MNKTVMNDKRYGNLSHIYLLDMCFNLLAYEVGQYSLDRDENHSRAS